MASSVSSLRFVAHLLVVWAAIVVVPFTNGLSTLPTTAAPTKRRAVRYKLSRTRRLLANETMVSATRVAELPLLRDDASKTSTVTTTSTPTTPRRAVVRRKRASRTRYTLNPSVSSSTSSKTSSHYPATRRSSGVNLPYESAFAMLRAYHAVYGDLVIPRSFVVPASKAFPREWHGLDLSRSIYTMRWWQLHVKQRPARVSQLNQLGFVWERLQPEWNLVLEALVTYSSIYGDVLVPAKFTVPYGDDRWPEATWGISLGSCTMRIRGRNDFLRGPNSASRRDQLDGLGFVWDVRDFQFRKFYAALRHFARLRSLGPFSEGRTKPLVVPAHYEIPSTDEWPRGLWGFPLGAKCSAVRQKELYIKNHRERRESLEALGFHWSGNADLGWLKVVHAAAIYSRINERKLDVPYAFKVPAPPPNFPDADEWPWPKHLWGLPLGQRLKDVRLRGAYLHGDMKEKRKRQLDALGFNWKPKRGRRKKTAT